MPPENGWHLTQMFEAMERGDLRSVFVIGENPAQSEADVSRAVDLLTGLDHLVVLDIYLTKTAELADVVLPGSASWCESDGTVTNSERRVQRVRKALDPPGEARDDIDILLDLARRLGHDWQYADHEQIWDELRRLSPMHAGMSWARLDELGGIQWPCPSNDSIEPPYLHGRLWSHDPAELGRRAPFSVVIDDPPVESLTDEFPLRLTTGRRLDSYNTGVQSGGYSSPNRLGETLDLSPEDAQRLGISDGELVRVSSPRGQVEAPARLDPGLRPGLVFMTLHFPDEVDVNQLTIDATDPKAGTAEFKAAAVRVDKLTHASPHRDLSSRRHRRRPARRDPSDRPGRRLVDGEPARRRVAPGPRRRDQRARSARRAAMSPYAVDRRARRAPTCSRQPRSRSPTAWPPTPGASPGRGPTSRSSRSARRSTPRWWAWPRSHA